MHAADRDSVDGEERWVVQLVRIQRKIIGHSETPK